MDASGVLDVLGVLTDVSGVVDEVAVSVSKFVENVVDRVVVGTPAVVLEISTFSTVSDGVVEVTDMDVLGILDEDDEVLEARLAVALLVQLSVVLVAEAVVVASLAELLVAVLVLDALAVVAVALVVWVLVDVSDVSVNEELPVEVADKLLVVIEMLLVAVDVLLELPVVDSVSDTVVVSVLDVVAEVVNVWLQ